MSLPPPEREVVEVEHPCAERWDRMEGGAQVRYCRKCQSNVYQLSGASPSEVDELFAVHEGRRRVQLRVRQDGTMVTRDCEAPRRAWNARAKVRLSVGIASGALLTIVLGLAVDYGLRHLPRAATLVTDGEPHLVPEPELTIIETHAEVTRRRAEWTDPATLHSGGSARPPAEATPPAEAPAAVTVTPP